mmetsp:Transcript_14443/g.41091  ORF Transcript_14443/g.41091 Transcript_14443/m.41091 type:complete len:215 (+) Transcript_14443:879-1523(+)
MPRFARSCLSPRPSIFASTASSPSPTWATSLATPSTRFPKDSTASLHSPCFESRAAILSEKKDRICATLSPRLDTSAPIRPTPFLKTFLVTKSESSRYERGPKPPSCMAPDAPRDVRRKIVSQLGPLEAPCPPDTTALCTILESSCTWSASSVIWTEAPSAAGGTDPEAEPPPCWVTREAIFPAARRISFTTCATMSAFPASIAPPAPGRRRRG